MGQRRRDEESRRQVRAFLMVWDPIGVAGVPQAADEYDCMIDPLLDVLERGSGAGALADWISAHRVEHFALSADPDRDGELAARLTHWWVSRTPDPG